MAVEPRTDLELAQRPQQSAKPQSTSAIVGTISSTLSDILGTTVATDAPLMSVGLDSISASEFTNALAERFDTELPQTLMFDHPTIDAMASFIAADEAKLAIWRTQVAEVRSSLAQRQATGQARVSAIMQIIEKTAMSR